MQDAKLRTIAALQAEVAASIVAAQDSVLVVAGEAAEAASPRCMQYAEEAKLAVERAAAMLHAGCREVDGGLEQVHAGAMAEVGRLSRQQLVAGAGRVAEVADEGNEQEGELATCFVQADAAQSQADAAQAEADKAQQQADAAAVAASAATTIRRRASGASTPAPTEQPAQPPAPFTDTPVARAQVALASPAEQAAQVAAARLLAEAGAEVDRMRAEVQAEVASLREQAAAELSQARSPVPPAPAVSQAQAKGKGKGANVSSGLPWQLRAAAALVSNASLRPDALRCFYLTVHW
jgi:hypothetical protein